jgi:predicted branched-subunit amino acid permease
VRQVIPVAAAVGLSVALFGLWLALLAVVWQKAGAADAHTVSLLVVGGAVVLVGLVWFVTGAAFGGMR